MNKKNIRLLADHIENLPDELFDMANPGEIDCGTPGCIMSHFPTLFSSNSVGRSLSLRKDEVDLLCLPEKSYADWSVRPGSKGHISKARAVAQLRFMANHGRIDWTETP